MSGNRAGGLKAAEKNRLLHGDDFYKRIGKIGGSVVGGRAGGFGSNKVGEDGLTGKERAKLAGAKGGKLSKRSKAIVVDGVKYRRDGTPYAGRTNAKRMSTSIEEALAIIEGEE